MGARLRPARRAAALGALVAALAAAGGSSGPEVSAQATGPRLFGVVASRYTFTPARIEVLQDDVVAIELRTDDIAHSLTIDEYRVSKRVSPGQVVTFEFRAERAGTFPFYCDLKTEDGCRKMRGVLVVRPRP